ncbi:MAG: hypothetical protein ABI791_08230 [Acidobacteriota bacterium]
MSSATIDTITKILESLPEPVQDRAVEHLRDYLEEITDEIRWDESFGRTSDKLSAFAQKVREEIAAGKSETMKLDKL